MTEIQKPWNGTKATETISRYARSMSFELVKTAHAIDQMLARDLMDGDLLYVLRHGFVYDRPAPLPATKPGFFRYAIEGKTPNSCGRKVRAIVIPDPAKAIIKVVTVMWADE